MYIGILSDIRDVPPKLLERLLEDCDLDGDITIDNSEDADVILSFGVTDARADLNLPYVEVLQDNTERYFDFLWPLKSFLAGMHSGNNVSYSINKLLPFEPYELLSCDIETTGLDFNTDQILLVGFSSLKKPSHVFLFDEGHLDLCKVVLQTNRLVMHNSKFDAKFLNKHYGIDVEIAYDTMLLHYEMDERRGTHGLKQLAKVFLGIEDYDAPVKKLLGKYFSPDSDEIAALTQYAAYDVFFTAKLCNYFLSLRGIWQVDPLRNLLKDANNAILRMETTGFMCDEKRVAAKRGELINAIDTHQSILGDVNVNSYKQVGKLLFEELGLVVPVGVGPKPGSTNAEVLGYLESTYENIPELDALLNLRRAKKILSTYVDGLEPLIHEGKVHASYHLTGTVTGRLSCSGPNIQNIPRETKNKFSGGVRGFFGAPEGFTLICADYSQAELRVAATLAEETAMLDIWAAGEDLHSKTCENLFGEVTPEKRTYAKELNFSLVYGAGAESLAKKLGISEREAQEFIDAYFKTNKKLFKFLKKQHNNAKGHRELRSLTGRVRRFGPVDIYENNRLHTMAGNFLVQSTASDICLQALIDIDECVVQGDMGNIVATVHDSIYVICPDKDAVATSLIVQELMQEAALSILPQDLVRFDVDVEIHQRWR